MIGARKAEPTISMGRDDLCLSNSAIQFAETYATNALADARLASSVRMVGIGGTRHMMNAISQPQHSDDHPRKNCAPGERGQ